MRPAGAGVKRLAGVPNLDGGGLASYMSRAKWPSPTFLEVSVENRIGFGKRFGAWLLDCVICGILASLLGGTIGGLLGAGAGATMASSGNTGGAMALGGAIGAAVGVMAAVFVIVPLYGLVEGITGWTLGKLMLGIKIGNADGTAAGSSTLLTRYVLKYGNCLLGLISVLSGIAILRTLGSVWGLIWFIGCFFALGAAKQALHDQIAKTAVFPKGAIRAA